MASQPQATAKREPTAERTIPQSLFSSAAVVRTLLTPKIKGALRPLFLAEGEGFEPPEAFTSTVFKTAAIDRSAILPYRPPQMEAVFCCLMTLSRLFFGSARLQITFSSGAPHSEHAPKRRPSCKTPFSSGAPLSEPVQAPFSTVCAEEEERQSACARVRADDVPDVVILDLMPREVGF